MTFQKGHKGYKKVGTKHKDTLLKEERRAVFDAQVSKKWEETINNLKPEYVADQFMGKAEDNLNIKGKLVIEIAGAIATKNAINTESGTHSK